jgi:ABC-type multidrug transport system permease subunit
MAANNVAEQYKKLEIEMKSDFRDEVIGFADGLWEPEPLMTIEYKELKSGIVSSVKQATLPASSATSAGLITAFIMFYMLFSSGWLIEERMNGTIKRLGIAKGGIAASFKGSVLALYAAGMLQILMFCAVQRVFFGITLFTGIMSYLVLFAYLLAVISVSLFLSSVLRTSAQLQAGAPVVALLSGFAGGCFWNFVEMPERIEFLSLFTPQGWALRGINGLLLNPADSASALVPLLVLLAIALILLPVSYIIIIYQKDENRLFGVR